MMTGEQNRNTVGHWIADRMNHIESSGIRKVFELAKSIQDPINLSIGQPDFDVPVVAKQALKVAVDQGSNAYTLTQGIAKLREKLANKVEATVSMADRELFITSGTSGGLVLALCCVVNPGDEVIIFDPYFVMYPHLVRLAGGVPVLVDTYPDFEIPWDKLVAAITPKTKAILFNNPGNPTGKLYGEQSVKEIARIAREKNILLVSDEVYSLFQYEEKMLSPAAFNPNVLVLDGFSKSYGMTGWRMGYAHGPALLIQEMIKLQQFTFVCAPSMVQWAGVEVLDVDMSEHAREYKAKRDLLLDGIKDLYEVPDGGGAFYLFPRAPGGDATAFVEKAIRNKLLIIPGKTFSKQDTNFRVSFAAKNETIARGIDVLRRLAKE